MLSTATARLVDGGVAVADAGDDGGTGVGVAPGPAALASSALLNDPAEKLY